MSTLPNSELNNIRGIQKRYPLYQMADVVIKIDQFKSAIDIESDETELRSMKLMPKTNSEADFKWKNG